MASLTQFSVPDYNGGSIANIAATAAALLNAPFSGLPPLHDVAWSSLQGGVKRVVLVVVDALGWNLWNQTAAEMPWVEESATVRAKLLSVFPSTTVAALSSIWTGAAPAQHGLVGLRLLFPEYGVLGEFLGMSPVFHKAPGSIVKAGLDPAAFLAAPGLAEQLSRSGISTVSLKRYTYVDSPLSQMHDRGVSVRVGIASGAELFSEVRGLLESHPAEPLFISAYWDAVDTITHRRGVDHPAVAAEVRSFFHLLQTELMQRLSASARQGTVILVTADHGQVNTPPSQVIRTKDHPVLRDMLLMRPAGEPRASYLYARQGRTNDVLDYLREHLSHALVALKAEEALAKGLLGPPPYAPETGRRLGDVVAIMRQGYVLLNPEDNDWMKARHGGLTAPEMEVPWLGWRLDR